MIWRIGCVRVGRGGLVLRVLVGVAVLLGTSSVAQARVTDRALQRSLARLVAAPGGPVGAIATIDRGGHLTVLRAGRADAAHRGAPRAHDHMRIASVSKAFGGAIMLHLVAHGLLRLDETIGGLLPGVMPAAWSPVTVREMLQHTSGLPDYTQSPGFRQQVTRNPRGYVSPLQIIGWVRGEQLNFPPGTRYRYSNTDNIVLGVIAQRITGESYRQLLSRLVFGPADLRQTTFPTRRIALPAPFMHGYMVAPGKAPQDVTTFLSPSGAWASGAIVSTPVDLGRFIRADLAGRFFGAAQRREQMRFLPGSSSPAGPGVNAAGLALFRYRTRCGTVYGHTGNFPGFVQWTAATADGRRSLTTSLNIAAPTGRLLARLRSLQTSMVCALYGR